MQSELFVTPLNAPFSHHDSTGFDRFNNFAFLPPFCCLVLSRCCRDYQAPAVGFSWGIFTPRWSLWWITSLHRWIIVSRTTQAEGIHGERYTEQMGFRLVYLCRGLSPNETFIFVSFRWAAEQSAVRCWRTSHCSEWDCPTAQERLELVVWAI